MPDLIFQLDLKCHLVIAAFNFHLNGLASVAANHFYEVTGKEKVSGANGTAVSGFCSSARTGSIDRAEHF